MTHLINHPEGETAMNTISDTTIELPGGRRLLGTGRGICATCGQEVRLVDESRRVTTQRVVGVHGPRGSRCEGSRLPGLPWLEACNLPGWAEMSDHDRGQALAFAHKVWWEQSYAYARQNYPPRYTGDGLADLGAIEPGGYYSARHASAVVRSLGEPVPSVPNFWAQHGAAFGRYPARAPEPLVDMARRVLGEAEVERLTNLTFEAAAS
jgi:hypothetical protein